MNKSIRTILKICSIACIVLAFLPVFKIWGISIWGFYLLFINPVFLILPAIPITMLVLLFSKSQKENIINIVILICSLMDLLAWIFTITYVSDNVDKFNRVADTFSSFLFGAKTGLRFESGVLFWVNIIVLALCIILSILLVTQKVSIDEDYNKAIVTVKDMGKNVSNKYTQTNSQYSKVCAKCGAVLGANAEFCSKCGTKYEKPVQIGNDKKQCPNCGEIIDEDSAFCGKCGTKYEETVQDTSEENKCPNCGLVVSEEAMFCRECGAKLK